MGSTHKDGLPQDGSSAQHSLFDEAGRSLPERNGAERDLSADRDVPLQSGPVMQTGDNGDACSAPRPIIVLPDSSEPVWARRIKLIIFVLFSVELGLALMYLPWSAVWTHNNLLVGHPLLRTIVHSNFTRGAITGLGLVDLWMGIWAAVQYREKN
jgi:hypothetical protein